MGQLVSTHILEEFLKVEGREKRIGIITFSKELYYSVPDGEKFSRLVFSKAIPLYIEEDGHNIKVLCYSKYFDIIPDNEFSRFPLPGYEVWFKKLDGGKLKIDKFKRDE